MLAYKRAYGSWPSLYRSERVLVPLGVGGHVVAVG